MSKILVVEDDPHLTEIITQVLDLSGHSVITAVDGVEALEKLRQEEFDLMLTDVRMPRMDGLELLRRLPTELPHPPKVVVMTADDTPETLLRALREQAYQYISKPFDPEQLLQLVDGALASSAAPLPIEVLSARPNWVELLVPCEISSAERIQDFLARLRADLPDEVRESVGNAFREMLLNAIEWGGKFDPNRKVRIAFLRARRMLLYRIADPGPGFNIEGLSHSALANTPERPAEHVRVREAKGLRPGGFGIAMVKAMVDELIYNEARNEVVLIKYLD
jgi:CheY-like chemotaxis protein/anti-sigma regulatory factor (Ser/Thr protein kinase)